MSEDKQYAKRDIMQLDEDGDYYIRHVSAMTGEKLHSKSDIAAELGWRDREIDRLKNVICCLEDRALDFEGEVRELRAESAAKQAKIDALMLEYCPNEMTEDQIAEWESHQCKSNLKTGDRNE